VGLRLAIVTGATSGIGRATALHLSSLGIPVALLARRRTVLEEVALLCENALPVTVDLIGEHAVEDAIEQVHEWSSTLGGDDHGIGLINAAGVAQFGEFHKMPTHDISHQISTNLVAPLQVIHAVLPWMVNQPAARHRIVNVLSIAAAHVFPGAASYSAAKAGLLAATRSLAQEYRNQGIFFTSILPGAVDTPIWDGQGFVPNREDMLSDKAVAEAIADILLAPADRVFDEVRIMPPKGIL
jgi:NAD(P)-dependent dehydrogenase (short-subunit alcohol dehydrogenase family)